MVTWLKRAVHRFLPRIDRVYSQPDFLAAWSLVHDDLTDFDEELAKYAQSDPGVRRAARLLLEREIERRRPGKADAIRAVALATIAPIALVGVGIWSDWSAALFTVVAESQEKARTPSDLSALFAEALSPTAWGFILVLGVLIVVLYLWAIFTLGADKKRGTHVAWLQAYREHEAAEKVPFAQGAPTESTTPSWSARVEAILRAVRGTRW